MSVWSSQARWYAKQSGVDGRKELPLSEEAEERFYEAEREASITRSNPPARSTRRRNALPRAWA